MSQAEFNEWKREQAMSTTTTVQTTPAPVVVHGPIISPGTSTPQSDTTPVSPTLTDILSVLPTSVVKALANIVSAAHKEAAFVMGILAAFDVVPTTNATTDHIGAILLLGYSSITHAANAIGAKKAS
jgi:hypothetical protein